MENETPRALGVVSRLDGIGNWESKNEEDGEDAIDNTNMMPIFTHTMSYMKRQVLVTYFKNNKAGITVFGFMLDWTSLRTIFAKDAVIPSEEQQLRSCHTI